MDFPTAKTTFLSFLEKAIHATKVDIGHRPRNPCDAMLGFRKRVEATTTPLDFKNYVIDIGHRLRGIVRDADLSDDASGLHADCIAYSEKIQSELQIVLADQIQIRDSDYLSDIDGANYPDLWPEDLHMKCRLLSPAVSETVKAVFGELLTEGNLDPSKFSSVSQVSSWGGYEDTQTWEDACQAFLEQLPNDADLEVIGWIGGDIVATKWSQVLQNQASLYSDCLILPTDAKWLLFFFHHDALVYGVR